MKAYEWNAIVDDLRGLSHARGPQQSFHVKMGGLVSCNNIPPPPSPTLALPINASVTLVEDSQPSPPMAEVTFGAKRWRPTALNVVISHHR